MRPTAKAKRARKESTMNTTKNAARFTLNFFDKTIKSKRTYEGMDYKFMEDYIATFEDVAMVKEYEAVKEMAENCGTKVYPLTKKWFLGKFSDMEGGFDMEAAKKDIAEFRIAQAEKKVAESLVAMAVATAAEQTKDVA